MFKGVAFFVVYLVTAWLGLQVDAVSGFATLLWLPTGLSLAFLFIFGLRFWPAIAWGALVANFLSGAPLLAAVGISVGNTLEALVGAYLLKRFVNFRPSFDRLTDALGLIVFAALLSTLISATLGVSSLWLNGVIPLSDYGSTWVAWWVGDGISNLIIAPLILVWSTRPHININVRSSVELVGMLLLLGLTILIAFTTESPLPTAYLVFPPLIWAALRFGPRTAITSVVLLSIAGAWYSAKGLGPFARDSVSQSLLYLESFIAVQAAATILLAAAVRELTLHQKAIKPK